MTYSHNLKIILLDKNNNIIEDINILDEIKNILCQSNTNVLEWNNKQEKFTIKWDKKILSKMEKYCMGDLFSYPAYEIDSIIVNHVQQTISKIDSKYNIKFYISRIIGHNIVCKDSYGIL